MCRGRREIWRKEDKTEDDFTYEFTGTMDLIEYGLKEFTLDVL